ncbi:hypothetical protein GDO81_024900 [Engystomops pustulosus]|uniref:Frog antimicrobial peptide propeptide domain-containing protein n=1 Tax=Engystomops pustulosus TaxID=76066 RepID=A0AAV6YPW3_ENGPU|nr:hypothetical protein GDO81_024900 [Engystomops pustulosus]
MTFLKKSLFLVLFLGLVSLSIGDEEKREEEYKVESEDNRELSPDVSKKCNPYNSYCIFGSGTNLTIIE